VVSPLSKKRGGPPVRLGEGHGKGSGSSVVSPLSKKGGGRPVQRPVSISAVGWASRLAQQSLTVLVRSHREHLGSHPHSRTRDVPSGRSVDQGLDERPARPHTAAQAGRSASQVVAGSGVQFWP
jgi:hypothetical protein